MTSFAQNDFMAPGDKPLTHVDAASVSQKFTPVGTPFELNDLLSVTTHTGYMFRMPLPMGAENGAVPLIAWRWGPDIFVPNIKMWDKYKAHDDTGITDGFNWIKDGVNKQIIPRGYVGTPLNNVELHFVGAQMVPALFFFLYRLSRFDIKYSLRFQGSYTGSGLFQVTPFKGIPRYNKFNENLAMGGPQSSAGMLNSSAFADSSKARELEFFYPYEYPYEWWDVCEESMYDLSYSQADPIRTGLVDNYWVLYARNTFNAPDNTSHIDIFVDVAFVNCVLRFPMLPYLGLFKAWLPAYVTPSGKSVVAIVNKQTTKSTRDEKDTLMESIRSALLSLIESNGVA